MGSWLSSIFGGSNPTLAKDMDQEGKLAGYSTGIGEGDTTAASDYYRDILSGDPSKEAQAIAPEMAAATTGAQQQKQTIGQFETRSGGTAGTAEAIDDKTRGDLLKLLGGLKSGAASGAAQLGTANLGMADTNLQAQEKMSQDQMQNWANSILGMGTTEAAGAAEGAALTAL